MSERPTQLEIEDSEASHAHEVSIAVAVELAKKFNAQVIPTNEYCEAAVFFKPYDLEEFVRFIKENK
jgi:hypothetical protein